MKKFQMMLLLLAVAAGLLLNGCKKDDVLGPVNDQATVVLFSFETVDDGIAGIVYRQVNNLDALVNNDSGPVLVVFYSPLAPVNSQVIPYLEQLAADYQGQLKLIWIDTSRESEIAESYQVTYLPHFTLVKNGERLNTLTGFDEKTSAILDQLIEKNTN